MPAARAQCPAVPSVTPTMAAGVEPSARPTASESPGPAPAPGPAGTQEENLLLDVVHQLVDHAVRVPGERGQTLGRLVQQPRVKGPTYGSGRAVSVGGGWVWMHTTRYAC